MTLPTIVLQSSPGTNETEEDMIMKSLAFVRNHLGMEAAYLSEFIGDDMVFRAVDAPGFEDLVNTGDSIPLDQVYCPHILSGDLPELIPDTADIPFTQTIALTHELPIRSHVSVPIRKRDGTPYGMFCCLSRKPNPTLNDRDMEVMRAFADLSAEHINSSLSISTSRKEVVSKITSMIETRDFTIAYQPIVDVKTKRIRGFEALTRFRSDPYIPPNIWFDDAESVGMQQDLEECVIVEALKAFTQFPENIYLSINASPNTVVAGNLRTLFEGYPSDRIVLEITEHVAIANYESLLDELLLLRGDGVKLAVDDAGAGYSGLNHIVQVKPDIIKLDISLTANIDQDVVRRSLGTALTKFAGETNCKIVAEGIETAEELQTLQEMGVELGQGYFLAKPKPLHEGLELLAAQDDELKKISA